MTVIRRGSLRPLAVAAVAAASLAVAPTARANAPRIPTRGEIIVLAPPKTFHDAVTDIERITGTRGGAIQTRAGRIPRAFGRSFRVDGKMAERLVYGSHANFRKAGFYLFRYERSFGLPGEKDCIGVLATGDADEVVRRMGTAGAKRKVTNRQIIDWLRETALEEPFELYEIGLDYLAGRFDRQPRDPVALARSAIRIAPDLVVGHTDPIAGLSDLFGKHRKLYLIWD
jgi:Domain of unknown function (DUF4253)